MAGQSAETSAEMLKNAVIGNPTEKHTATVIFFHGLGDTGHSWCSILGETKRPYVKLICPTAPVMPVSVNRGFHMPSWFDIYALNESAQQDEEGIKSAARKGGISQGGALAMFSALTYSKPLAGILALSSWLPLHNILQEKMADVNRQVPFLQCHGDFDVTVQHQWGVLTSQFIQTFNTTNHQFKTYHGLAHWCCPQEMKDVQEWLDKHLPSSGDNV